MLTNFIGPGRQTISLPPLQGSSEGRVNYKAAPLVVKNVLVQLNGVHVVRVWRPLLFFFLA